MFIIKVIAATVASDPTKYSEAFLGKPNEEYCAWILNPEKWGGMLCALLDMDCITMNDMQNSRIFGQIS